MNSTNTEEMVCSRILVYNYSATVIQFYLEDTNTNKSGKSNQLQFGGFQVMPVANVPSINSGDLVHPMVWVVGGTSRTRGGPFVTYQEDCNIAAGYWITGTTGNIFCHIFTKHTDGPNI